MKALSIKQPWAYLIVNGYKDIENRTWPTNFRGRIYVHTGKSEDEFAYHWLERMVLVHHRIPRVEISFPLTFGAIIGEVDIIDCVLSSDSPWYAGQFGFVLSNPVAYAEPIPCKGKLGFFEPEIP